MQNSHDNFQDVLTVEQASRYLQVSLRHMYQLLHDGVIPHRRVERKMIRIHRSVLDDYIKNAQNHCAVRPVSCKQTESKSNQNQGRDMRATTIGTSK